MDSLFICLLSQPPTNIFQQPLLCAVDFHALEIKKIKYGVRNYAVWSKDRVKEMNGFKCPGWLGAMGMSWGGPREEGDGMGWKDRCFALHSDLHWILFAPL